MTSKNPPSAGDSSALSSRPIYPIPAGQARAELRVVNSRFIATAGPAFSVEEARAFVSRIKAEFSDATHNVPAYIVGHGASVISHCHDDGEPSGTAGRPALAVLAGSGLGDVAVVVTRYFGGTRLGTGGLVRAYSDAVRAVLAVLPRARRIAVVTAMAAIPYNWLERMRLQTAAHGGQVLEEVFAADITVTLRFPVERFADFQESIRQASHATLQVETIERGEMIVPLE